MSAESTLYSLLSGNAGVTALVASRIYPDLVPEEKTPPYIGYEQTGSEPVTDIAGTILARIPRFTIACWATTRIGAEAIADAVSSALANTDFTYLARNVEIDETTGRLASTLDYQILI